MMKYLQTLFQIGIPNTMSPEDAKSIRMTNMATFAIQIFHPLAGGAMVIITDTFFLLPELALIELLSLFVYLFNRQGKYSLAIFYLGCLFNCHYVYLTIIFGNSLRFYIFIFLFSGRVLLIPESKRQLIIAVLFSDLILALTAILVPQFYGSCLHANSRQEILMNSLIDGVLFLGLITVALIGRSGALRAEKQLKSEQERSEKLLLNILPPEVAEQLKQGREIIADNYAEATVLFSDIVGFTALSRQLTPDQLIRLMNDIFSLFDDLAQKHGLEKIKTIGDGYMLAGGLPVQHRDHAVSVARMALDMHQALAKYCQQNNKTLNIRTGIDTGPVVAGVIGKSKFAYDLWGPMVNTASRMESSGFAGRIQVTETFYQKVKNRFDLQPHGSVKIKGIGRMKTWFLIDEKR
ncbi:adenylate/guanylate cyclase domain-containing protein [candidate division CSSED10-310 bacterium]|uniref:Adenylate/guanylate cyclase domain-containing protein n=1 Tax=candidate division CSSED10-310 bacterium TaxID=2855610 RepID=A0ABV6Z5C3_UNCC1